MLYILFTFILLTKIISAQLSCDSLEYVLNNRRFQEPAGVCYSTGNGEGTMLTCNQTNNDMDYKYFRDPNCNDNPYLTASVRDTMNILGVAETDYTITCCTTQSCEYSIQRTYATQSCSDDISTAITWTDNVNIMNGCSGFFDIGVSSSTICRNNNKLTKYVYANQRSCESIVETRTVLQDQCNADGTQIGIICGTATLTCIMTTTLQPTDAPSERPSEQATLGSTFGPTEFTDVNTEDSNDSSDSIENNNGRDIDGYKTAEVYEYGDEQIDRNEIKHNQLEKEKIIAITFVGVTCFCIISGLVLSICFITCGKHNRRDITRVNSVEMDEDMEEEEILFQ